MEPLKGLLSFGNKKLPKDTAIFNMGAASDCPSDKLGLCKVSKECYAKKAEKMYPSVLPYRKRQANKWLKNTAETFVSEFLEVVNKKRLPIRKLRINESGDFYSQNCVNKAEAIATSLKAEGIVAYCYTARKDLDYSGITNLIINGSGFKVDGIKREFTAVNKIDKGAIACVGDCKKCSLCASDSTQDIQVLKH